MVRRDGTRDVTTTISRDAVITGEHVISTTGGEVPAIAAAGDGFLVATGTTLQRVDRNGIAVGGAAGAFRNGNPRIACTAHACLVAEPDRIILVDHEGRPLREPQPLGLSGLADVAALPDGSFRVYTVTDIFFIAPDGTLRGSQRWNDTPIQWGGVETFRGRPFFFYSRDGRAYLRDLPPRSRAVRH